MKHDQSMGRNKDHKRSCYAEGELVQPVIPADGVLDERTGTIEVNRPPIKRVRDGDTVPPLYTKVPTKEQLSSENPKFTRVPTSAEFSKSVSDYRERLERMKKGV